MKSGFFAFLNLLLFCVSASAEWSLQPKPTTSPFVVEIGKDTVLYPYFNDHRRVNGIDADCAIRRAVAIRSRANLLPAMVRGGSVRIVFGY